MSILIKGMEMPTVDSMIFAIRPDGMVEDVMGCYVGKAVPVPPHGRLIDADALHYSRVAIWHNDSTMPMGGHVGGMNAVVMSAEINNAPTIIPAEEEKP